MGRSPCCDKNGLKKGPWTPEEDTKLIQYIQTHGAANWRNLPKNAGLLRCGKSCRLRWTNYLRPDIKRGRWSAIAARLPGRTDNEIKNYWNTHIRKRLLKMGIDPVTHAPRLDFLDLSSLLNSPQLNLSNLVRLQTLLNPEALGLALHLLSSSNNENPNFSNPNHNGLQYDQAPIFQPNQFENVVNQQIPSNHNTPSFQNQTQSLQGNMGHFSMNSTNSSDQMLVQDYLTNSTTTSEGLPSTNLSSFFNGVLSDQMKGDLSSENSSFDNSVLSTPLSSPAPLNSASTFINRSTEDEREISFCSDLLRFEIPDSLDLDDFM
ncbi:hypothetical protein DH2020_022849 [Rehmannia glutinosa]|uniref:R2R3-MYB protein n=1 Tax=Rehmannia glutinosa TaxID=99300 RepID=A0ABR0W7A1_REHGL